MNPTGNPGLATGGTGDVLAGIVGALLARGTEPWPAACAAVYLHGAAGDRARDRRGEESLLAGDLLDAHPGGAVPARVTPFVARSRGRRTETEAVAAELARGFRGGEVVLLSGELGAGKTAFVRGLARGLGAGPGGGGQPDVRAPHLVPGPLTLHHADLYRLAGGGDDRELGLEELPGPRGVLAVEWAERLAGSPGPVSGGCASPTRAGDRREIEWAEEVPA